MKKIVLILFALLFSPDAFSKAELVVNYDFNDLSFGDISHGTEWTIQESGGVNDTPAARLRYADTDDSLHWSSLGLASYQSNEFWVEFDTKIDGTPSGGSKFVKFFGDWESSKNNMTFSLNYFLNQQVEVSYYGDAICAARYMDDDKTDTCGANVIIPGNPITINGTWGHWKLHVKRADPAESNGEVQVWWNDVLMAHFTEMNSNPEEFSDPTPGFDSVQFGGYMHGTFDGNAWYLWIDNLTIYSGDMQDAISPNSPTGLSVL